MSRLEGYALSPQQREAWFNLSDGNTGTVNAIFNFGSDFDWDKLCSSVNKVLENNQLYKLKFITIPGITEPLQHFGEKNRVVFQSFQIQEAEQIAEMISRVSPGTENSEEYPLLQVLLYHTEDRSFNQLVFSSSPLCADLWSIHLLAISVFTIYDHKEELPEAAIDYLQFAEWQNQLLETDDVEEGKLYWQNKFAVTNSLPDILFSKKNPELKKKTVSFTDQLSESLSVDLQSHQYCESVLAACWYIVLCQLNHNNNFLFGHVNNGRSYEELYHVIGNFARLIPLQLNLDAHLSLSGFIQQYEDEMNLADMHKEALLVNEDYHNFIKSNLLYRFEYADHDLLTRGLYLKPEILLHSEAPLALQLQVTKVNNEYHTTLYYDSYSFDDNAISYLFNAWQTVLRQAIADNGEIIATSASLTNNRHPETERKSGIQENVQVPDTSVINVFRNQVANNQYQTAVADGNRTLSYGELDQHSSLLAAYLLNEGYLTGHKRIGIIQGETAELIISILAVLKAGGTYVPIDPNDAEIRIRHILSDSEITCVLTASEVQEVIIDDKIVALKLDKLDLTTLSLKETDMPERSSNMPAYIIYTSGTSGLPKGVIIKDSSLVNYTNWLQNFAGITEKDSAVLLSSYAFDLGYTVLWGTLLSGGTLHLILKEQIREMDFVIDYILTNSINFIKTTPSFFNVLIRSDKAKQLAHADLRLLILGGEIINVDDLAFMHTEVNPGIAVINHYGPTETTIGTIAKKVDLSDLASYREHPVIGMPVTNNYVIILDHNNKPAAPGIMGEICIGGSGLAEGYLNLPDLTNEKFAVNADTGERLYHSGDAGCVMPDGNILYLGRRDDQVKIRGYRVEPGEVKLAIYQYPGVDQVVISTRGDIYNKQLIAYITSGTSLDHDSIKAFLKLAIPDYMVPAHIMQLNEIPLTANHKIDYKALPDPETAISSKTSVIKPKNSREAHILKIWREVLGNENIAVDDDFFDLGGHSLKAIQVVNRLQKELKIKASIKDIFAFPTIRAFYEATKESDEEIFQYIESIPAKAYYELSNSQKRIWFTSQRKGARSVYNVPQYCLFKGKLDIKLLQRAFAELIRRHESLRTIFKVVEGEVVQYILAAEEINFSMQLLVADDENRVTEIIDEELATPFDLENDIGIRAKLISTQPEEYLLLFTLHHIISDGWSREIIYRELMHFYEAGFYNKESILISPRIQYKDYVNWHNQTFKDQEQFWVDFFKTGIPNDYFPLDYKRPEVLTFEGNTCTYHIEKNELYKLKTMVGENKVTLNSLLLGVYGLLLGEYGITNEVILGTVVSGRNHIDLEEIVGVFINYLPFKIHIDKEIDFITYINTINENLVLLYQHQDYPFDLMVEKFAGPLKPGRNPVFDTMIIFHEEENRKDLKELPGDVKIFEYEREGKDHLSKLDFKLDVTISENGISIRVEYNKNLFRPETMELLLKRYTMLLSEVAQNPLRILEELQVISAEEKTLRLANKQKQEKLANRGLKIISSFTVEPLEEHLNWWLETFNQRYEINFGRYHQVFQELLSIGQKKTDTEIGTFVLLNRFEDYVQNWDSNQTIDTLDIVYNKLIMLIKDLASSIPLIIVLTPPDDTTSASRYITSHINLLNETYYQFCKDLENVYLIDLRDYKNMHPGLNLFDRISYKDAYIPFTDEGFYFIGYHINRLLWGLKGNLCKVIALDCDNTLWEGVCGEDPIDSIQIGEGYRALQQYFIRKYEEGFLLVLLSKNNEKDVWNIFENHPDMLLKQSHFIGWKINWEAKSKNIRSLAKELNLGLDSFAFIDDNPLECYHMMQENPEVLTLELPDNQYHFSYFLNQVISFDKLKISREDTVRNEMYKAEIKRTDSSKDTELSVFLENLQLEMSFRPVSANELERVAQLTMRTNQFNLNGIRRSKQEIAQLLENKDYECYVIHARDRFGDYGLVGAVIFEHQEDNLYLHSYMLSCRALGRGIEGAVLYALGDIARHNYAGKVVADFRQTQKNMPFSDFLISNHWIKGNATGGDEISYHFITDHIPSADPYITVYVNGDLPLKEEDLIKDNHPEPVDFVFDHIGIAVKDINETSELFERLGFNWGQEVFDPLQSCMLRMGNHSEYYNVELIAGVGPSSPINNILHHQAAKPYHICFRVKSHQEALDYLLAGNVSFDMIKAPEPAVLFNNLKVLFIHLMDLGLIELIEDPDRDKQAAVFHNVKPALQVISKNKAQTVTVCQLLGFNVSQEYSAHGNMIQNKQAILMDIVSADAFVISGKPDDVKKAGDYRMALDSNIFKAELINTRDNPALFTLAATADEQLAWIWNKNLYNEDRLINQQVYKALEYGNLYYLQKMKEKAGHIANEIQMDEPFATLIRLFSEILKNNKISINDDFFQLGGHSIKAVQLLSRIYQTFNVKISLSAFFEMSTVKLMAQEISRHQSTELWIETTIAEDDESFDQIIL